MAFKNPLELANEIEKEPIGKSLYDLDKEGFEGPHNQIINGLRNSAYDTYEDAMKHAAQFGLDERQMKYVSDYAKQVFGIN